MKVQIGQYKFGRHRNRWGMWQYTMITESGTMASFVKDVYSFEEAVKEVYHLNGWGTPKMIKRNF